MKKFIPIIIFVISLIAVIVGGIYGIDVIAKLKETSEVVKEVKPILDELNATSDGN